MKYKIHFILLSFILMAGCYTIIKHPAVSDQEDGDYQYPVYFSDDCSSCHSDNQPLLMTPESHLPHLNYIYSNDRWYQYYESPWWSRDIFYQSGNYQENNEENGALPTTSARRRFPGAGGNELPITNPPVSGGNISSGSNPRIINPPDTTSTSNNNSNVRQGDEQSGARKIERNSGNDNKSNVRKVERKKK
jgi:hypothetical protein